MSDTECGKCGLDFSDLASPSLVRCKTAGCPLQKGRRGIVKPALVALGVSVLVVGGGAAALSSIQEEPEGQAAHMAEVARIAASEAAEARAKAEQQKAALIAAGGTGIVVGEQALTVAAAPPPSTYPAADPAAVVRVSNFDCGRRASYGRALVCSDIGLALSDYNLSLLYKSVLAGSGRRAALRKEQADWLGKLDTLGTDRERVTVLYRERFNALSLIQAGV